MKRWYISGWENLTVLRVKKLNSGLVKKHCARVIMKKVYSHRVAWWLNGCKEIVIKLWHEREDRNL